MAACAVLSPLLFTTSCSSGSTGPEKGTPAFYWAAAKETFAAGDYLKTLDNLDSLTASDNEFTARARAWHLVLTSGMARGYMDLADAYETGARMNKANPGEFRKQVSAYRGNAGRLALRFADSFAGFQTRKEEKIPLALGYPQGSAVPVVVLARIGNGILPQPAEVENAERAAVRRQVLLAACRAAGAPDDSARAAELLKNPDFQVDRPVFVIAMAGTMHDEAQLFGRQKLDQPEKFKIFCARAQEALKSIPESKESKDLNGKIEKTIKALGKV